MSCVLCNRNFEDADNTVVVQQKGPDTINSTERGDNIHVEPGTKIHVSCRRDYCCKRSMQRDLMKRNPEESTSLTVACVSRSTNLKFDFRTDCFMCSFMCSHSRVFVLS